MPSSCSSAHRCALPSCPNCCWKYSLHMCRRIEAVKPRRPHAIAIGQASGSFLDVGRRRRAIHNVLAYQRRRSAWWKSVGLWLWINGSAFRGVVELGSVTADEFGTAFRHHGPLVIRPITAAGLRVEVYDAARGLDQISAGAGVGRYQPFKIAISAVAGPTRRVPIAPTVIAPMPILV